MAEQLQPSLLDRLTDDEPEEQQESRDKGVLSMRQLRECVIRDLDWLFNTSSFESDRNDLSDYPLVAGSVLNYGTRDLSGLAVAGLNPVELERRLRQTILDFEPRIQANTVKVRVEKDEMSHRALTFEISGELWGHPMPIHLLLKTTIDLETGNVTVSNQDREASD